MLLISSWDFYRYLRFNPLFICTPCVVPPCLVTFLAFVTPVCLPPTFVSPHIVPMVTGALHRSLWWGCLPVGVHLLVTAASHRSLWWGCLPAFASLSYVRLSLLYVFHSAVSFKPPILSSSCVHCFSDCFRSMLYCFLCLWFLCHFSAYHMKFESSCWSELCF